MTEIIEKENKDKKWNENEYYFLIKDVKLKFKNGYETEVNLALTERELIEAIKRANRNPEDFKEIDESIFDLIGDFFS